MGVELVGNEDLDAEIGVGDEERKKRKAILDKRTGKDLKAQWENQDREEIEARERHLAPPPITVPQCTVCNHPYRPWVERALVKAHSYAMIARMTPPDENDRKLSSDAIRRHAREHMPIESTRIRMEQESAADMMQQNYDTGIRGAFTNRGALDVLIRKAYEDALSGVTTVEPKDLIQMIKLQNDMEVEDSSEQAEQTKLAMLTFARAMQNILPEEQLHAVVAEAERLRSLDDVDLVMQGMLPPPKLKVIEATVEEE